MRTGVNKYELIQVMGALCPGQKFTNHLAGSTTDKISRMTKEMPISVVRYGCTIYVWLSTTTYDYGCNTESYWPIRIDTNDAGVYPWLIRHTVRECVTWALYRFFFIQSPHTQAIYFHNILVLKFSLIFYDKSMWNS